MIEQSLHLPLKEYNSFGIEAQAEHFATFESADDLRELFATRSIRPEWRVLSGGNNTLFTADYHGTILHPVSRDIAITGEGEDRVHVRVEAGVEWDELVAWSVERGLWGLAELSGIPGYAGAAPVQNIGAYGAEAKDVIESVELFYVDDLREGVLANSECAFGYRESIFKHALKGKAIILAINVILSKTATQGARYEQLAGAVEEWTPANVRAAVLAIRSSKLPDPKELGNAGSFFKNPVVSQALADKLKAEYPAMPLYGLKLSAGWLIEQAGWKGKRRGAVGVHERQALVLVNYGGATGNEILAFAREIVADVATKFGVTLEMEVNVV